MVVRIFAPVKINLMLRVVGQQAAGKHRGYHDISSLVVFGDYGDHITIAPSPAKHFAITGDFTKNIGADDDNFVNRAIALCEAATKQRFTGDVIIEKKIPIGGGLGGGTSDGVAMIKYLGALWRIDIATQQQLAQQIGADGLALFHGLNHNSPCLVAGIGDVVTPVALAPGLLSCRMLLVWDGTFVSTNDVFRQSDNLRNKNNAAWDAPITPAMVGNLAVAQDLKENANSLEAAAFAMHPRLQQTKNMIGDMAGCVAVNMTGSGGCFYALFDNAANRARAMASLKSAQLWAAECGFHQQ
ncbi:MAG: hypothetical protein QM529_05825 [Hydrotalea sp.]|nr:hypothetical protein [Hydrotalea sp.]